MRLSRFVLFVATMLGMLLLLHVMPTEAKKANALILINLPSCSLEYYVDNVPIKEYPIAIGSPATPTPLGAFSIIDKEINPWWYPPNRRGYFVPSGPDNPLGYRWMGFLPTYGIHGTNAPWSIGRAISNGCIRMQEDDVEELYEMVAYHTPVTITYDRIKLRVDSIGNASIGIYPDIYGYMKVSVADASKLLAKNGLDCLADTALLSSMIVQQSAQQIILARVYSLEVNGKKLPQYAAVLNNNVYVPIMAIADAVHTKLDWDENRQLVTGKQHAIPGTQKGNTVYVLLNDLSALLAGHYTWKDQDRCLSLKVPSLTFNGRLLHCDVQMLRNNQFVPALTVAAALERTVIWNTADSVLRNSIRNIPVKVIDDEPYIETSKLTEYFHCTVTWDEEQQILELVYPSQPIDVSMYLDLMENSLDF